MEKTTPDAIVFNVADMQKKIASGKLDEALSILVPILSQHPDHADANYMAAVCYRYKNNHQKAQHYLDILKGLALDKGRVYQEQGHLFKAQNKPVAALTAYQSACQLNSALLASWKAMLEIATHLGETAQAQQALMQLQRLQMLPKELLSVIDLTAQGRLFKAEQLCKQFLQKNATNVEAMRLLADIAMRLGAMDEAEFLLESAIQFAAGNTQLHIDYVAVLRRRQKYEASQAAAQQLLGSAPDNPQLQSIYAIAKLQMGEYEQAVELFDKVLKKLPTDAVTFTSRGHALKTWGKNSEAIASYQNAIKYNKLHCEAYYALANLKTYRFDDDELASMLSIENSDRLSLADQVNLSFALGKVYEDRKCWQLSFEQYKKGNRIKKQQSSYSAEEMTVELLGQREFFSASRIASLSQSACQDASPIFIVGLPRAGSTLLEQILSSHSMVDGTLELPNMLTIAQQIRRKGKASKDKGYPDVIDSLTAQELRDLGQRYIDETQVHRQGAPFFIDKMPNNFRHIGLIKAILPNAKIIDARRHPIACCFSGFKQLFAEGQEFSYSLEDIAQYYNDYVALMAHWDAVLPNAVLRVDYEQVTAGLDSQVRRILDYCQLPFEAACLDFHKTERAVRTASSEQVRQPLYQSGVDQWRNFEPHLSVLTKALTS